MKNLTFTDAVILGKMLVEKPLPYIGGRCLMGMAAKAIGVGDCTDMVANYRGVALAWPWLESEAETQPCGCNPRSRTTGYGTQTMARLMHIWDHHYFGDETWSWERLLELIKQWDPGDAARLPSQKEWSCFDQEQIDELASLHRRMEQYFAGEGDGA